MDKEWDAGLYQVGLVDPKGNPISLRADAADLVAEAKLDPATLQEVQAGVWLVQIDEGHELLLWLNLSGKAGFQGRGGRLDVETP